VTSQVNCKASQNTANSRGIIRTSPSGATTADSGRSTMVSAVSSSSVASCKNEKVMVALVLGGNEPRDNYKWKPHSNQIQHAWRTLESPPTWNVASSLCSAKKAVPPMEMASS
jgi:hypothetical protein